MDPELKRLEVEFEKNIDHWLSKHGVLYQLKHAAIAGAILPKICALLFRVLIIILIALAIGWIYLTKHVGSESYKEKVTSNLVSSLNASKGEIKSIKRHKGGLLSAQMLISNFELESSETSFYEDWYVAKKSGDKDKKVKSATEKKILSAQSIIVHPLGLGDGIISNWSGKKISLGILDCHLKTGADNDEAAKASYLSIFKDFDELTANSITIESANIGWGYDAAKGSIQGESIEALRKGDVWYIMVTQGKFSHGWLQNTNIESMSIECHKSGLVKIIDAKLSLGEGVMTFDAEIQIKATPEVTGRYQFKGIKVLDLIGQEYSPYLGGKIKGEGILAGNLNTANGVSTKTKITLEANLANSKKSSAGDEQNENSKEKALAESYLIIRNKFPILTTMQDLNKINSYHQLKLNIGEFSIEQKGGDTIITDIGVRFGDFIVIDGALNYVWTKVKNKKEASVNPDNGLNEIITGDKGINEIADEETIVHELVKTISGDLRIGFITEAFNDHPEILKVYPEDSETLRVWLPVKMQGELKAASTEIAEELHKIVRDARDAKENE